MKIAIEIEGHHELFGDYFFYSDGERVLTLGPKHRNEAEALVAEIPTIIHIQVGMRSGVSETEEILDDPEKMEPLSVAEAEVENGDVVDFETKLNIVDKRIIAGTHGHEVEVTVRDVDAYIRQLAEDGEKCDVFPVLSSVCNGEVLHIVKVVFA